MSSLTAIINVLIFVIDDNQVILDEVKSAFKKAGIINARFFTNQDALYKELIKEVQIAVIDYYMPGTTGLDVMRQILKVNNHCLPIIMTSQENPDIIIELYDNGLFRYVRKDKPGFLDRLVGCVRLATEKINCMSGIMLDFQETHKNINLLFKTCNTPLNGLITADHTSC